jgi:hypothetical protein
MSASIQGSYGKREKGFLGGIANSNPITSDNNVAGEDTKLGKFVKTSVLGAIALTGASDVVAGVVTKTDALATVDVKSGSAITLLKGGSIFVHCEPACTKGEKVFVRHTANGVLKVGDVRKDEDTSKAIEIAGTFSETLGSAGIVEIQINL